MKAQRKAARQAALEHKEEETQSAEELANQVVWAKLSTYPWWPAQVTIPVCPSKVRVNSVEPGLQDRFWFNGRNVGTLEELANQVASAKLSTYPWWPAQVTSHASFRDPCL